MSDLCVAGVPIFQGLARADQEKVARYARPQRFGRGEIVWTPGQPVSKLLVLHTGSLKVVREAANGKQQLLRVASDGDVVGEREFLTGHRPEELVVAMDESQVCSFDHDDLAGLLREFPNVGERMLRTLSDRVHSMERLLAAVTSSDVRARVAAYLLHLAEREQGGSVLTLPMAKYEVAAYLGTTPETLSRRLAALADEGTVALRGRRVVEILEPARLEAAAEPKPGARHS